MSTNIASGADLPLTGYVIVVRDPSGKLASRDQRQYQQKELALMRAAHLARSAEAPRDAFPAPVYDFSPLHPLLWCRT